jgi:hypothetical protein
VTKCAIIRGVKLAWIAFLASAPGLIFGTKAEELSTLVLPVRIPLDAFVREAEGWIPKEHQSDWQALERSAFGQSLKAPLATRFSIRRRPIEWRTLGDRIEMRLPVTYRVELGVPRLERSSPARLGMGWKQVASCEPSAGAVLRVETRLDLLPTWAVHSVSRPVLELPGPCQLRALREHISLDITPRVRQVFTASLERSAIELDRQIETRTDLRRLASTLWARLHEPIPLGEQTWLMLRPRSVSIDRPRLENGEVRTGLRLLGYPEIAGTADSDAVAALPPLVAGDPEATPSFSLDLDLDMTWPELNERLRASMIGKVFKTGGNRKLRLTGVSVAPNGDRLVMEATVEGSFKGHMGMSGRPTIHEGTLIFEDLRYTLSTDSMLVRFANWLRQDQYRRQFMAMARVNLVDYLTANRKRIEESMRTSWTGEFRLEGQIEKMESAALEMTAASLRLRARAVGQVTVLIAH